MVRSFVPRLYYAHLRASNAPAFSPEMKNVPNNCQKLAHTELNGYNVLTGGQMLDPRIYF